MKIISGLYKGRVLSGFNLAGTRPTMDRVKESLFAIISSNIQNSIILDLFSGSGNLGIEALSQGAKYAYLVDNNSKAITVIKKNISDIRVENTKVLKFDYQKALEYFKENSIVFDVIFLDPPYDTDYIEKSISLIEKYKLLKTGGIIICESSDVNKIIYSSNYLCKKEKKYGDKWVVILEQL